MSEVLSDIFSLFYVQTPDLYFNKEASEVYESNTTLFIEKAKLFTQKFASS